MSRVDLSRRPGADGAGTRAEVGSADARMAAAGLAGSVERARPTAVAQEVAAHVSTSRDIIDASAGSRMGRV